MSRDEQAAEFSLLGKLNRLAGVEYPDDDLQIVTIEGKRRYARKDGTPY